MAAVARATRSHKPAPSDPPERSRQPRLNSQNETAAHARLSSLTASAFVETYSLQTVQTFTSEFWRLERTGSEQRIRIMQTICFIRLVSTLVAVGCWIQPIHAQAVPPISGTWFGSIVLTDPNGKRSHDTAVLVVDDSGSAIHGRMGRTIDQMTVWPQRICKRSQAHLPSQRSGWTRRELHQERRSLGGQRDWTAPHRTD